MKKFVVERTHKNTVEILYVAKNKEDGMKVGNEIYDKGEYGCGMLSLCERNLDENNKLISGSFVFHHVFG